MVLFSHITVTNPGHFITRNIFITVYSLLKVYTTLGICLSYWYKPPVYSSEDLWHTCRIQGWKGMWGLSPIPCSCKQAYHTIFLYLSNSTLKAISFLFLILYTLTMLGKLFQGMIAVLDKILFSNFQHKCTYLFLFMPKLAFSLNNSPLSLVFISLHIYRQQSNLLQALVC